MKAKKVILQTYYNLDGNYIVWEYDPLHNTEYENANVKIKRVKRTLCGITFDIDVIDIEGYEPIECELLGALNESDGTLIIQICQDWG